MVVYVCVCVHVCLYLFAEWKNHNELRTDFWIAYTQTIPNRQKQVGMLEPNIPIVAKFPATLTIPFGVIIFVSD